MIILEDGQISVPFTRTNGQYTFTDALVMPPQAHEALTETEIIAMQDARFAAWLDFITVASSDAEVTNGE
jgi:hypothetical protein